jgi:hypothetical protein
MKSKTSAICHTSGRRSFLSILRYNVLWIYQSLGGNVPFTLVDNITRCDHVMLGRQERCMGARPLASKWLAEAHPDFEKERSTGNEE